MKKLFGRILAVLLAVCMVFGGMKLPVLAEELTEDAVSPEGTENLGETLPEGEAADEEGTDEASAEDETADGEEAPAEEEKKERVISFTEDINTIFTLKEFSFMLPSNWGLFEETPDKDTFITADGLQKITVYALPYEDMLTAIDAEFISEAEAEEILKAEAEAAEAAEEATEDEAAEVTEETSEETEEAVEETEEAAEEAEAETDEGEADAEGEAAEEVPEKDTFDAIAWCILENLFPEDMDMTVRFAKDLSMRGWLSALYQINETGERIFLMEGVDNIFAAVYQSEEKADFGGLMDFRKMTSYIGVEIPPEEPVIDPKKQNVGLADEGAVITEEYTYTYRYNFDTMHFLVFTNTSESVLNVSTSSIAYDADGNVLGASDASVRGVGPGCTGIAAEYFEISDEPAYYVTEISAVPTSTFRSSNQDITVEANETKNGAVFTVTNNGDAAIDYTEGYALFFKDGELAEYDWLVFADEEGKLKSGKNITKQADAFEKFDEVQLYINSYDDIRVN